MSNKIMRVWLVAVATCFLVIGIIDGGASPSTAQADAVLPSVSIVPEDQEVWLGESFNVNVVVDSSTYNLKACHVEVSYDSDAFTVGSITEAGLLGTDILSEPGSGVSNGLVTYGVTRVAGNTPQPVSGALITIAFTVGEDALSGTYTVDVQNTILKDEDNNTIYAVLENDGLVTVSPPDLNPWAYDENSDGVIQKSEAIDAVQDYFSGKITKEQAIEVVMLYFG